MNDYLPTLPLAEKMLNSAELQLSYGRSSSGRQGNIEQVHSHLLSALSELRAELIDTAFDLEVRPRLDAADLASIVARRLERLVAEASSV